MAQQTTPDPEHGPEHDAEHDPEHVDVLIVGAGISGIGAAYHLSSRCPERSYLIVEARAAIGGTWDLFRYPGVRSDSDMHTLGYGFAPWLSDVSIADGPAILDYLTETARRYGIDQRIRFHRRVVATDWSSADQRWTVELADPVTGDRSTITCGFLWHCSGYYDAERGYAPEFPGAERVTGRIVHPQHWPEDLDYTGKRVVVIGSGATAITLVPAMTDEAAHVTMLQRSPTYIVSLPKRDPLDTKLRKVLPVRLTYPIVRWKNVLLQMANYQLMQAFPRQARALIRRMTERELPGFDLDTHFTPRYDPWDERLCVVPDGDLFRALRAGTASVVTGQIESFTERGIRLTSGEELEADVVVTATGLNLRMLGGVVPSVDGTPILPRDVMTYRGLMLEGVPNFAYTFGYVNSSWTLRADLVADFVTRLLAHMRDHGYAVAVPVNTDPTVVRRPLLDFTPGYIRRSLDQLPKQGSRSPWTVRMNYPLERLQMKRARVTVGMRFERPRTRVAARAQEASA
ncbi:flavin-containing monooxygenase [Pseudonocardia thermophila]|uniref:flavin-containing monooxygenase n=1 Tax=Pseudonocardia thermophila TaxID=1848 RepID=UPI00248E0501|nr:NAD(P)/FAD-dependent oxidoreductase [Pseudonocardia thermophila]